MFPVPEVTGLLSIGIFIAGRVIRLADSARRNREKCSVLKARVEMISLLLTELQNQWTPDPVTSRLLQDLNDALDDGRTLVQSCQDKRTWSLVFRTQKKARKFDDLDQRITRILEMFHIANMILIVKTNRNGAVAARASTSSAAPAAAGDVAVLADLAGSIVQKARTLKRNSEEIQQLVQFVKQAANEMKQLQSSNLLSWDPSTKPMVDELKDLLQQAHNILSHHNLPHRNNSRTTALGEADQILQVAYKIEYYVQVLPVITMRQIHIHI